MRKQEINTYMIMINKKSIYTLNLHSDNIYFQRIEKMIFIEEDLTNIGQRKLVAYVKVNLYVKSQAEVSRRCTFNVQSSL